MVKVNGKLVKKRRRMENSLVRAFQIAKEQKEQKNTVAVNLELLRGLLVGPELVRGHGERHEVEQRRDPAVEGGLLVARVQGRQPLRRGLTLAWQKIYSQIFFRADCP